MFLKTLFFITIVDYHVASIVKQRIFDNSHWDKISSFIVPNSTIPVAKYQSSLTGLSIAVAKAETPIVNGYFCLPTQVFDNDGLPHILEHLIFLGSEDYPFKEVLDLLANRCLASRTNAWTSTDHTCYTVYTAGTSGFLRILPIYLDHILFPNLRDEDYLTEVHHINGKGRDAGVVYSEMQGSKYATSSSRALKEKLYPGNSGYYAQTGGNLENIRTSTTIEKVRAYHKKFYRPENLLLTITGRIDEKQLFDMVRPIEEKILAKRAKEEPEPYSRHWHQELNPTGYEKNHVFSMEYPDDDESKGHVLIAWRLGEDIVDNIGNFEAYLLIMKYLTSSKISPFEAAFVEITDPLARSTGYYSMEYKDPALAIKFSNVPTNRTHEVIPKMYEVINKLIDDGPEKFDLERIHDYVDRGLVKNLKENENSPHTFFPDGTLLDKLYGEKTSDFRTFIKASQWSGDFKNKTATYWLNLIDNIFNKKLSIAVEAKPKTKLATDASKEEEERTQKQIEELGEEGRKKKDEELKAALKSQIQPSDEVLSQIPLGDVSQIEFRSLKSYNRTHNKGNFFDFSELPFKVQVEDVNSEFVQMYLYLNTSGLTVRQRKLLPLLMDLWLNSPIKKNGIITDIDGVIKRWSKLLQKLSISLGYSSVTLAAQFEIGKLEPALDFIGDRLNFPYFTIKEVNTTITSRLNKKTPSATSIRTYLSEAMYFDNTTNQHYVNYVTQKEFLQSLQEEIKENVDAVIKEVHDVIEKVTKPDRAFLSIAGNATKIKEKYGDKLKAFNNIFNASDIPSEPNLKTLTERYELKREHEYRRKNMSELPRHVAIGVDSTKSCYMTQMILFNNTDWTDPEISHIRVLLRYLSDRLYNEVRGKGLTYSISMYLSVSTGQITLKFSKSSQLADAYAAVVEILTRYINEKSSFEKSLAESAKGALIYSWSSKEETITGLIKEAVRAYIRRIDSHYNRQFTRSLADVTSEDMAKSAKKILPLFLSPETTQSVVVCSKGTVNQVVEELNVWGMDFTVYDSLEDSFVGKN